MLRQLTIRAIPIAAATTIATVMCINNNNNRDDDKLLVNPIHILPAECKSHKKKHGHAKNIMLQTHRSRLCREMEDKYIPDWKNILGEGAYGSVHLATSIENPGLKVALKKISKRYTNDSSFKRETNALLKIHDYGGHPNVAGLRDMYEDHNFFYLILDLVQGGEMFEHLIRNGAYSERDSARLFRQAASALYFMHGVGIIHSDLKPENLMLSTWEEGDNANVKVVDFGCAVLEEERESNSKKEIGTTAYWPPESFQGAEISKEMDMWSMGVILYIMLTGHHPFDLQGTNTDDQIEAIIKSNPAPPLTCSVASHLSRSAKDLIVKLMAQDPKQRMTAEELLNHPWVTGITAKTTVMPGSDVKLSQFGEQRNKVASAIFAVMIANSNSNNILQANNSTVPPAEKEKMRQERNNNNSASSTNNNTRILEKAFEVFSNNKGFISKDDLGRVISETTGVALNEQDKDDYLDAVNDEGGKGSGKKTVDLSAFSTLMGNLETRYYGKGREIFKEGEVGDCMYFLNSGKAEVKSGKNVIGKLSQGDFFGEGCLLGSGKTRNATVLTSTPVEVIEIPRSEFENYTRNSSGAKNSLRIVDNLRSLDKAKNLIRLAKNVKTIQTKKGMTVFREGDAGNSMFTVAENGGQFEVHVKNVLVGKLRENDMFGETSLLMNRPRSATITCVSEDGCVSHEMMNDHFQSLLRDSGIETSLRDLSRRREFKKALRIRAGGIASLKDLFESADADGSGLLNLEEVRDLIKNVDNGFPDEDIVKLMKTMDVNNDGKINFQEFERVMALGTR